MKLTIDNLDGLGAVDYSAAIDRSEKVEIVRTLNAPSTVRATLCLAGTALATPVRRARLALLADAGTTLFTGYLTTEPVAVYAGVASEGHVYRLALRAVSDEWLLDRQAPGTLAGASFGTAGGAVVRGLLGRLDPGLFSSAAVQPGQSVGVFQPRPGGSWSTHAGEAAGATYAAYRVLGGAVGMQQAGSVTHALSDGDGSLQVSALHTAQVRELANDVTLTGQLEPATYWTEVFKGDGTTVEFDLTGEPAGMSLGRAALLADNFQAGTFNRQRWALTDPGSHLLLGAGGLVLNGGNGFDGQTTLVANDAVEMGGTLVLELRDVLLDPASAGVLGGLYGGIIAQANCMAGFLVQQQGGNTVVAALVNGVQAGSSVVITPGHSYTLRLHLHCAELLRVKQAFYARTDVGGTGAGGTDVSGATQVARFGGGEIAAPLELVFELRDQGRSSNTPVQVLYDGVLATSFAAPQFCLVNSVQLFGSVGAVALTRTGTTWIHSADPVAGTSFTRLAGVPASGLDCVLQQSVTGKVTFFNGRVPGPDEYVTVLYRGRSRAVARLADAASVAAETAGNAPGTARWLGRVERPHARSSEDCENAAQAVLAFATQRAAAVAGSYTSVNPPLNGTDLWPGDVLSLSVQGGTIDVVARQVTVEETGAVPEALTYRIAFANDWAESLGIALSESVAADAVLPEAAVELAPGATPASPARFADNLTQLTVVGFNGTGASSVMTLDAGQDPPPGGGFEVRRSDGRFGSGVGAGASGDLVLRSPVRGFSIPRAQMQETFYVRMYDGSTPPLYSRVSAAIVTHTPFE